MQTKRGVLFHTFVSKMKNFVFITETHLNKFNLLNAELNPICHILALLRAHPILHVSRIRVNSNSVESTAGSSNMES
jgi:hypothetical protein